MPHDPASLERARAALSFLNVDSRDEWVMAAMALRDEFGENAFDVWDAWSALGATYNERSARAVWKSCKPGKGTGMGSLIKRAKEYGWQEAKEYRKPSKEEIEARQKARAERDALAAQQEKEAQAAARKRAVEIWNAGHVAKTHPYLERKGVPAIGLRVGAWEAVDRDTGEIYVETTEALLIPIQDRSRQIHSLQRIHPEEGRRKLYLTDGAKRGHFCPIGAPNVDPGTGRKVFLVGEGYATCCSAHLATGHMALVAFDRSNLGHVARQLRQAIPDAIIVLLADNDTETDGNPGLSDATAAAHDHAGVVACPPPGDFNDLHQSAGLEAVAKIIGAAIASVAAPEHDVPATLPAEVPEAAPAPDEAPPWSEPAQQAPLPPPDEPDEDLDGINASGYFTILGFDRNNYFFFSHRQRQILNFSINELSKDGTMLALAPTEWWDANFGNGKGEWLKKVWMNWAVNVATSRGIYDSRRMRGRGAGIDNGRTVYHYGSALSVDGTLVDVTKMTGSKYVYELSRDLPLAASEPLSDDDGQRLADVASMMRWTRPASGAMLAGWTFLAPICGALAWRPHIWLTGPAGCGKSSILNKFVDRLTRDYNLFGQGSSTEAGVRQNLQADALPVLIDEAEKDNESEQKRIDGMLALIRQASTETRARTLKGTTSGTGMDFHIRSMFCLASVQVGMENKADVDRLAKLTLMGPSEDGGEHWSALSGALNELDKDETITQRMLARALAIMPQIHETIRVFIRVAGQRQDWTQRMADQYGTMIAGCWSLQSKAVPTPEQATKFFGSWDWSEVVEATQDSDDAAKCLQTITEAKVSNKGETVSIATLVSICANRAVEGTSVDLSTAKRLLHENGMHPTRTGDLMIAHNNSALRGLMKGSRFGADLRGQLMRLPGAVQGTPVAFGSCGQQRGIIVPLGLILGAEEELPI